MATRQYIGARYVPKFYVNSVDGSAAWEANVVYDPLTWVTLTNGHIYLSRKQVPATVGTPASNANYWLDVGSYNGFIEHLQDQIDDIVDDVADLYDITNRRFILIGDSYAAGHPSGVANGWVSLLIDSLGLTGDQVYYSYDGGYGFVGNNASKSFLSLITGLENTVVDPDTITDIVVCGGYNDFGQSNVGTAVTTFVNYCKLHYPHAIIHIGMIGYDAHQSDAIRKYIPSTIFEYYVSKPSAKVHILNGVEYALRGYADTMVDGVHPTQVAYWALAKSIISALFGGDGFCQYRSVNGQMTTITDLRNQTSQFLEKTFKHEVLLQFGYHMSRFTFDSTSGRPTANQWFKVGDLSNSIAKGIAGSAADLDTFSRPMEFLAYDTNLFGGHHYGIMHGAIAIMDNAIYVKLNDVDPSTGGFYVLDNLTSISPWGNVTFNLLEV